MSVVRTTYAITWQRGDEAAQSGRLELAPRALLFEGSNGGEPTSEAIPYVDVTGVRVARSAEDRLSNRQTLLVERRSGDRVRIASIVHPGIVSELSERLASLYLAGEGATSRVLVVLPLVEGARERAAELLRNGPPFDPGEVGLGRHHVFLTESEAIFLFEADSPDAADRLLSSTHLWAAAAGWKDLVAGPPRIASTFRAGPADYVSFEATPGPGDSDGGDVF